MSRGLMHCWRDEQESGNRWRLYANSPPAPVHGSSLAQRARQSSASKRPTCAHARPVRIKSQRSGPASSKADRRQEVVVVAVVRVAVDAAAFHGLADEDIADVDSEMDS